MDKESNGYDKNKQSEISQAFYEFAVKNNFKEKDKIKNLRICYNDFSVEMKTDINNRAYSSIGKQIKEKYAQYSLWNIYTAFSSVVVFFYNEKVICRNSENGISNMIRYDYFTALKVLDEFDVYSSDNFVMTFDSKENLDKNYQGNLYYYFK